MTIFKHSILMFVMAVLMMRPALASEKEKWLEQKGDNFIIYYHDRVPLDFVETVMLEAEENFRRVMDGLGLSRYQSWRWDNRASIYVYNDEQDYVSHSKQAAWSHGVALVRQKMIITYPSNTGFFDTLLPHELAHIVLHEYLGDRVLVPLWMDEGIAMYMEKARRLGAHAEVRAYREKGEFIPLSDLNIMPLYKDTPQDLVTRFYAHSASIINFMILQKGDFQFYKILKLMKERVSFEDAMARTYGRIKNLNDLNKEWVKFLEEE